MADSDVHEAIQLDADISALVSPSVSELWRAMHGYPAEATGAVAAHRALNAGGVPVTSREDFFGGADVPIANGSNDRMNWAKVGASTLFDLTDPSIPVAIAAGVYAGAAAVQATTDMTVDGFYGLVFELDSDGEDASVETESRLATAAKPRPKAALSGTYYIPAGGTIRLKLYNFDGANTITFGLASAFIQRLS